MLGPWTEFYNPATLQVERQLEGCMFHHVPRSNRRAADKT